MESTQLCPLHPGCVQEGDPKGEPGSPVSLVCVFGLSGKREHK